MSEMNFYPVLGTEKVFIPIKESDLLIKKIEFVDTIPNLNEDENKWDVSNKQDGTVMAWMDNDTLKISGNGPILANENCNSLFGISAYKCENLKTDFSFMGYKFRYGFINVESIKFNDLFVTSKMKTSAEMFIGCENLKSIDVANWDIKNLEYTFCMFYGCERLEEIDLSRWNTQRLRTTNLMFEGCENLEKVITSSDKIIEQIDDDIIIQAPE